MIGNAVHVMRIATGEIKETVDDKPKSAAAELGSKSDEARAEKRSPKRLSEIARKAAATR